MLPTTDFKSLESFLSGSDPRPDFLQDFIDIGERERQKKLALTKDFSRSIPILEARGLIQPAEGTPHGWILTEIGWTFWEWLG